MQHTVKAVLVLRSGLHLTFFGTSAGVKYSYSWRCKGVQRESGLQGEVRKRVCEREGESRNEKHSIEIDTFLL